MSNIWQIIKEKGVFYLNSVFMMFTACLPLHTQNLLNKQMIIENSCLGLANTQDERFTPVLVIKMKANDC
jgi:hypothetical protein